MASAYPHVNVVACDESSSAEPIPAITRAHEYAILLRQHAVVTTSVSVVDSVDGVSPEMNGPSARGRSDVFFVVGPQSVDARARIEVAAQRNGCLALFEDDAIAVVVAVRSMSALTTFSRDLGRIRVAVVASTWSSTISSVLLALGAGEVVTWNPCEAPAMSYADVLAWYDIVVNPTLREALHSTVPSHVVGYPREALDVCGLIVPPLIGTLCDSDATSVGIEIWVAVARALLSMTEPDIGTEVDKLSLLIAASVRRALRRNDRQVVSQPSSRGGRAPRTKRP